MEDADHGASPTTVEVHDKEHYRPKLHAPAHRFFIHLLRLHRRVTPIPMHKLTNSKFFAYTPFLWKMDICHA
jgi:hypothetical protein